MYKEFQSLYEGKLETFLQEQGISPEDFALACKGAIEAGDGNTAFVEIMMSMAEYSKPALQYAVTTCEVFIGLSLLLTARILLPDDERGSRGKILSLDLGSQPVTPPTPCASAT